VKTWLLKWLLRQPIVRFWLLYAAKPAAEREEVKWTQEDVAALNGFLGTGTGKKLMVRLENMKADSDAHAVLNGHRHNAADLTALARGARMTVARIKQLTADQPDLVKTENGQASLPADLAYLSEN
jgi:hypothetical protein